MKLVRNKKLITVGTVLVLVLSLINQISSYKTSAFTLKKYLRGDFNCADTLKTLTIQEGYTFPCKDTQPKALDNAIKQNEKAYALLQKPNAISKDLLKVAATKLFTLFNEKLSEDMLKDENLTRVSNGGVYNDNPGDFKTKITVPLQKVSEGTGSPKEIAGVLAIMADIGTAIVLYKDPKKGTATVKGAVEKFAELIGTNVEDMYTRIEAVYKERGITVIWKNKYKERTDAKIGDKKYLETRSGIFNLGKPELKAKFTWESLPNAFFANCETEPFTAHYSGTVFVTLITFDLLMETDAKYKATSAIELSTSKIQPNVPETVGDQSRVCRAALAAAELLAIGYHSALEIKPVIWMYLGKNPPKTALVDPATTACDANATSDITGIMDACTEKRRKIRKTVK